MKTVELTLESTKVQMEEAKKYVEKMLNNPDARFSVFEAQIAINTRLMMICLYLLQEVERLKRN